MKVLKLVLMIAALAALSGCILVPWDWDDDHGRGGGGEHGEHHEGHR